LSLSLSFGSAARAAEPKAALNPSAPESAPPIPRVRQAPETAEVVAPSSRELERARQHFDRALDCYSRGLYRDAIHELELARELDPEGKDLVYNLALVHEKLGELEQSLAYYRAYLAMEQDSDERARTEASIVRLEGALEQERLQAEQPPSSPALPPSEPANAAGHADTWVWATAGLSVVALLSGVMLGVRALALRPGTDSPTGGSRSADDYRNDAHDAHRSAVAADIAFAVGLGAGAAATLLYFGRTPPARSEVSSVGLREPGRPDVGLDVGVRF